MKTVRRWLFLAIIASGCAKHNGTPRVSQVSRQTPPSAFSNSLLVDLGLETPNSARDPKFVLVANDPTQANALLWDGYVGVNVGPDGTSHEADGISKPSFVAFELGGYDGYNEKIQSFDSPLDIAITANGVPAKPIAAGYWQSLDMRYGLLTTHWFAPVIGGLLEARQTEILSKGQIQSRWEFKGP